MVLTPPPSRTSLPCGLTRLLEDGSRVTVDEVERGVGEGEGGTLVVGHDEHRSVEAERTLEALLVTGTDTVTRDVEVLDSQ
ncbi:hypothetical protein RW1_019_00200 [Rhodococcus wratislaviensis NBRC 100605]|uniref:Uncharacterized protein n=1 Tax=Rhodococcus wratislaviensis NBRC 100605 TaxID=1219028 RepID=X0PR06_RHOWR|nr:hypothetical protein RW1_019_00200 [Rhodococcus wratislaviensis NBRC 100605]